jgi:glyoxylase-like metal-dependent hydrolase (beta-lactamase superfamily II)
MNVRLVVMTSTFEAASGVTAIDTRMCGREQVTSAYLLEGEEPALVETGPTTSAGTVVESLGTLGVGPGDLAHIVVTHIHLDHAGGAGAVAPHFPRATVWVHERGAPHLVDPARLMASAAKIYGEERLHELFGPVHPLPAERVRALTDGDRVDLGNRALEAIYTPGHASHHVCLLDSRSGGVFVGDALGVFLPDVQILRPATPPPEFHLEQSVESINRVLRREPSRLLFSHFGPADEPSRLGRLAIRRLERWTELVDEAMHESDEVATVVQRLQKGTAEELDTAGGEGQDSIVDRYELLSSYEMNALGIMRYLRKARESADRSST